MLSNRSFSPIVTLNKTIALAKVKDAESGLSELQNLKKDLSLSNYLPFYITLGELQTETGRNSEAVDSYEKAVELSGNEAIRRFLQKKMQEIKTNFKSS